jgi:hypothetical protein
MEYKELKKIVQSKDKFRKFLIDLLKNTDTGNIEGDKGEPVVACGYDDGYYWDYTSVALNENDTLNVTFNVGSGNGWIPCELTEYEVSIEDFRLYLINRKWKDADIDTLGLLETCINDIEGAKIVKEENE